MDSEIKIAFGGGCHWCTEAVFQTLKGVSKVVQGYVASTAKNSSFSEAVVVHFDPEIIELKDLIAVHLETHNSTSNHSMREKYRSAIYTFDRKEYHEASQILSAFQKHYDGKLITRVLPFKAFKASRESIQNYYLKHPKNAFCERYIHPKLAKLRNLHADKLKDA